MKRNRWIVIPLILLCFSIYSQAQAWSGILDPSRAIDWTQSGVPGGIPARTTNCATINASTYGNGSSDATAGIQNALNACASGQVVSLSAGTFRINGNLSIPSNVSLRGAGAQNTILNAQGNSGSVINLGSFGAVPAVGGSVSITGGATAGSSSLTLSKANGIAVGSYLLISELNDSTFVTISVPSGTCTWCDNSMWNGTRVRGQIVEVTSVSGTSVGIAPPLYSAYTHTPLATPFTASAKYAGVEYLQVYANNTGYTTNFAITECAYCWIEGVESNYTDGDHVEMEFSYRGVVRDSYFSNAYLHTPGTTDSDVFFGGKTSGMLVENNILERLHSSVILNWGAAGNVIGYNYSIGSFDTSATNSVMVDFDVHGAHPQFNLWEGNVTPHLYPDSFWGSGSHNTSFRNWLRATTLVAPPYTGRGVVNWAGGHLANQQNRGITLAFPQTRYNLVGNASGSADASSVVSLLYTAGPVACPACDVAPGNRDYSGTFYGFDFGYDTSGDSSGAGVPSQWVGVAYSTAFMHGNYDTASNAIFWNPGTTHTLPASFYQPSKPSWFGNAPWPPIGPDVTGGIDDAGHVYAIPAEVCYNNTAKDANGMITFDANTCYGSAGGPPAPPTGLKAQVQ